MIPDLDLHGVSLVEELILRSRISIDMMKRYPAMGSPCLQPLPTVIWGEMLPFGMVTLLKLWRRVAIHWIIVLQKPKSFRVDSMYLKEMLSKALLKSS